MKKYVIYFGIIFIDNKNALFQRANSLCKNIVANGYTPIMIGMTDESINGSYRKRVISNNQLCYEISYPHNMKQWIKSLIEVRNIISIFDDIQSQNIESIIVADYRFIPMCSIKKYCEKNSINFAIDIQDWFIPRPICSITSLIKSLDNILRLKVLYPRVNRKICISGGFAQMYRKTTKLAHIPGTIDPNEEKWEIGDYQPVESKLRLSFAGNPGKHCEKEKINWVLQAISEIRTDKIIEFYIAGVSEKDFLSSNPGMKQYIEYGKIHFLGKISHNECIRVIKESDFSVVIRPNNKLSNFGFSTKISESFACGVPIIATNTSDLSDYIIEGENGFICECDYVSVKNIIEKISMMDTNHFKEMHSKTKQNNPLIYTKFNDEIRKILL